VKLLGSGLYSEDCVRSSETKIVVAVDCERQLNFGLDFPYYLLHLFGGKNSYGVGKGNSVSLSLLCPLEKLNYKVQIRP
jgi:hypothetical protein